MGQNTPPLKQQFFTINLLKSLAIQFIMLHHLSNYGAIADAADKIWPYFFEWIGLYGRYAVQVFLVISGYLAIQNIAAQLDKKGLIKTIVNRYLRLVPTYFVAILITILCAFIARLFLTDEYIGTPESFGQIISHLFLLQHLLDYESISLGVWYVAIDWQLYIFFAVIFFFVKSYQWTLFTVCTLMLGAFLYFSQMLSYENYFLYFIGSYGLGMLAYLWDDTSHHINPIIAKVVMASFGILLFSGVFFEWNTKNLLAYVTAVLLIWQGKRTVPQSLSGIDWSRLLNWISQRSYCAFLIHFAFILIGNTAYFLLGIERNEWSIVAMLFIFIASWMAAHWLYMWVEYPLRKFQIR